MSPIRVVVADDSNPYRTALCAFLRRIPDFTVVAAAHDGEEALRLVESLAPDLLILDIQMPNLDGWEVLRQLDGMKEELKILVLSAHDGRDIRQRAIEAGAAAFVPKGDIQWLTKTLRQLGDSPQTG